MSSVEVSQRSGGRAPFVTSAEAVLEPVLAKTGVASRLYPNLVETLFQAAHLRGDQPALRAERGGQWVTWTWAQYRQDVLTVARGLLASGFQAHQSVAILGFNSPEWFLAFFGAIAAGGKAVGIYATNNAEACRYIIEHSDTQTVVVENVPAQLEKLQKLQGQLPQVQRVLLYDTPVAAPAPAIHLTGVNAVPWAAFMAEASTAAVSEADVQAIASALPVGRCCSLVYTSGTTGNPKAVMLSHDCMAFTVHSLLQHLGSFGTDEEERLLSYLPLSHIAAQVVDLALPVVAAGTLPHGCVVTFARPDALSTSLMTSLQAVQPTLLFGVPRVWEKMTEGMKAKLKDGVNAEAASLGAYRKALGLGKCKWPLTGAAPIAVHTLNYLETLGITVHEVYGMSECTGPATLGVPGLSKTGSTGTALPGVEVRIDHDPSRDKAGEGEVLMRGRSVMMGYMKDPKKSAEAIDADGWLHSGDVGRLDDQGFLYITGRIKELLISAGGENIAPVPIEDELKRLLPGLSQAVLIGDRRKFLVVLVTLKTRPDPTTGAFTGELIDDAREVSPGVTTVAQAQQDPRWQQYIGHGLHAYNSGTCVSNAQKIQKFAVLPTDFSIASGELTATMKLRRSVVCEKYASLIDSLYAGSASA
eukprot:RCo015584